ncbi:hypothetical protein [Streptomyces sp. NPDC059071]|uniref:hypothetical protein n=1 Tax=unclassified Streptomyces TaxID=2593676 RepID=UPI0036610001
MGSKSARHAHREKTRKRRRKPPGSSADTHTFGTFSAAGERLAAYRGCETFEEAAAVARSRLDESLDELVRLVEPYDPWDVLDLLQVRCTPPPPAAGQQPDPEAIAALVDLVAVIVRPRGVRDTARPAGAAGGRPQASPVIEEVHRLALDCLRTGADAIAFEAAAEHKDALARIRAGAVLREMTLRNAVYPHMLRDTLRALFAHPDVTADCQAALGFTVDDAISVLEACGQLRARVWGERTRQAADAARMMAFVEHAVQSSGMSAQFESQRQVAQERLRNAVTAMSANSADEVSASVTELSAHTGVAPATVGAVVDAFVLPTPQHSPYEAALQLLTGSSPLRMKPLLRDATGRVLLVHGALHLPAIMEVFEQRLKDAGRWDTYSKHRGAYLEDAAAELLQRHLPGAAVHKGFEYFVPDPNKPGSETSPGQFTKCVEGDVLLVAGDIALIVEAKAVALNPRSRAGESMKLRRDLTRIVTDAASQAQRLRERIETDGGLRLRDTTWLDLAHVREVHSIAVSLEDLSGIVTTTAELVQAGLLPAKNLPWTVSLHDLRVISELVERPAELIVYLRRRTEPETTQRFVAVDELDLFLYFYEAGLYVEPDPEQVARAVPQSGPPTVAAKRRRKAERAEIITSRTELLDAWYFSELGLAQAPVPKPALTAEPAVLALIDEISALGTPGWLPITATLLEGSAKTQRQFGHAAKTLCRKTLADGHDHKMTLFGGTRQANTIMLVWMTAPHPALHKSMLSKLQRYVRAKKHQLQMARAAGLLFDAGSGKLTALVFDNRRPGPDPALDQEVVDLGLKPVSAVSRSLPPPRARLGAP